MASPLADFYERAYTHAGDASAAGEGERWRALSARGKAAHVIALCAGAGAAVPGAGLAVPSAGLAVPGAGAAVPGAGLAPASTLEVGCGDGAVLCELARRGFGGRLQGVEIAAAAVSIARARPEIEAVELYDGTRLPYANGAFDLGVLSHVLEHVPHPAALLAEAARVCRAVVVEVPLEDNLSARRAGKRAGAAEVGHLQRLSRTAVRAIVAQAGLCVVGELEDPLGLEVHRFFARGRRARGAARVKWAVRAVLHSLAPRVARRLFTLHYACLCLPPQPPPQPPSQPPPQTPPQTPVDAPPPVR